MGIGASTREAPRTTQPAEKIRSRPVPKPHGQAPKIITQKGTAPCHLSLQLLKSNVSSPMYRLFFAYVLIIAAVLQAGAVPPPAHKTPAALQSGEGSHHRRPR